MEDTPRSSTSRPPSSDRQWTRVIVLAQPPGTGSAEASAAVSPALTEEFQRRDWFAVTQSDPYLAFAELALRERAQVARAAWGLHRMEGLALLILEPDRWDAEILDDLHLSVRHWLSDTISVWFAEGNVIRPADRPRTTPPFATMAHSEDARSGEDAGGDAPTSSSANSADQGDESLTSVPSKPARTSDSHRLSREEIDMLLRESEAGVFESGRQRGDQP